MKIIGRVESKCVHCSSPVVFHWRGPARKLGGASIACYRCKKADIIAGKGPNVCYVVDGGNIVKSLP